MRTRGKPSRTESVPAALANPARSKSFGAHVGHGESTAHRGCPPGSPRLRARRAGGRNRWHPSARDGRFPRGGARAGPECTTPTTPRGRPRAGSCGYGQNCCRRADGRLPSPPPRRRRTRVPRAADPVPPVASPFPRARGRATQVLFGGDAVAQAPAHVRVGPFGPSTAFTSSNCVAGRISIAMPPPCHRPAGPARGSPRPAAGNPTTPAVWSGRP